MIFNFLRKKEAPVKKDETAQRHADLDEKFRSEISELFLLIKGGDLPGEEKEKIRARIIELEEGLIRQKQECKEATRNLRGLKEA